MRSTWTRLALPALLAAVLSFAAAAPAIAESHASVTVGATAVEVAEGGEGVTYTVVLESEPTGDVVVTITPADQITTDVADLTFTTANWNVEQVVTVTVTDDDLAEGDHTGVIAHSVSGGGYDGVVIADVFVQITDNDSAGVTLSAAEVAISEGGDSATYTVVLDSEPAGDVVVAITTSDQLTVDPSELTFTAATWNVEQVVTVTAADDDLAEGDHAGVISHSAAGGGYDDVAVADVSAQITDNDLAGISVSPLEVGVSEGGATATYTVVLNSEPAGDVVVTITTDDQITTDVADLTFTTANWSVEQVVTVTATDDDMAEGDHTALLTHLATSTDGDYDGIGVPAVTARIADNDVRGATIAPRVLELLEGGDVSLYTVVLDSEPSGDVVVTIAPDDQLTVDAAELTFTVENWNVPQAVTVTATDNDLVEGDRTGTVAHRATGGGYDEVAIPDVTAEITDDDTVASTGTERPEACDEPIVGGALAALVRSLSFHVLCGLFDSLELEPDAQASVARFIAVFAGVDFDHGGDIRLRQKGGDLHLEIKFKDGDRKQEFRVRQKGDDELDVKIKLKDGHHKEELRLRREGGHEPDLRVKFEDRGHDDESLALFRHDDDDDEHDKDEHEKRGRRRGEHHDDLDYRGGGRAVRGAGREDGSHVVAFRRTVRDASTQGFAWPLRGSLTSRFGRRHQGIDIRADYAPVSASAAGKVVFAGGRRCCGYGLYVDILHADGYLTRYAHLSSITVRRGESVDQGEVIGRSGDTGRSTGPHLHFEVRHNDSPVDPLRFLP